MDKHTPAYCSMHGCKEEATRWFEWAIAKDGTYYLCPEHAEMMSPEDDVVEVIHPDTGKMMSVELAVYACSEQCEICNY